MNRNDIANAFLAAQGDPGMRPVTLDRAMGGSPGNSHFRFTVAGTAPAMAVVNDYADFFFAQSFSGSAPATAAAATITPSASLFTNAQVGAFLSYNPMQLRNLNVTGADVAATVSSMQVEPHRETPMNQSQSDTIYATQYQNAGDFQATRVQVPLDFVVDGYSFLRLVSTGNATPASYTAQFIAGPRPDRRLEVPSSPPAVIVSPR